MHTLRCECRDWYFLIGQVPANHLLSASVMSAPAALAMSKLLYPETQKVKRTEEVYNMKRGSVVPGIVEIRNLEMSPHSSSQSTSLILRSRIYISVAGNIASLDYVLA